MSGSSLVTDGTRTYRFTVITADVSENPTHEPAAIPGGSIFVSVDLILAAQDENEFAGMLAHAIGHIEARHGTIRTFGNCDFRRTRSPLASCSAFGTCFARLRPRYDDGVIRLAAICAMSISFGGVFEMPDNASRNMVLQNGQAAPTMLAPVSANS